MSTNQIFTDIKKAANVLAEKCRVTFYWIDSRKKPISFTKMCVRLYADIYLILFHFRM